MADTSCRKLRKRLIAASSVIATAGPALASGGSGLPWDQPIQKLVDGVSGPVAFGFAFMGLIALGVRWIYGGDLGPAAKMLMTLVIGVSILAFAAGFLAQLFGLSGAVAL
ncbi:MAG: TrbC/VirB2 family protein [Rhodobacteraceae bacterium]|jgi:type IV secretion system protein VirB2|nr:TrbC/VirB2 family protein [Paracoccaceae bacterium]